MICSCLSCPELQIGTDDINDFIFGLVSFKHRSVDEVRSVPIPPLSLSRPNRRWRGGRMIFAALEDGEV
jgi:hypothetical protein